MDKFTKITINGRQYDSVDQMPTEVRRQYLELMSTLGKDADGDGVPDVLQQPGSSTVVKESITFNGREYNSRDELPPDVRKLLDQIPPSRDGNATEFEVKTEQILPSQTLISEHWDSDDDYPDTNKKLPWLLVLLLAIALSILITLWFSGVKPAQLFGH